MIQHFSIEIEEAIKQHAEKEYPNECCGLIVGEEYIPMKNISDSPETSFRINPEKFVEYNDDIRCVIHSHCDTIVDGIKYRNCFASKKDQEMQISCDIPYGICHVGFNGKANRIFYFGDSLEIEEYIGRPYIYGVYDCFSLVRDYYKKEFQINMPNIPRQIHWWNESGESSMFDDYFEECGFVDKQISIKFLKKFDVVLMNINGTCVNHCGIYLDHGLMIHHRYGHLSRHDPLMIYKDRVTRIVRHKEFI